MPGSVAQRNHNPGNLRAGPGSIGTDSGGYAVFPDDAAGYKALNRQIDLNIGRGLTLNEFFAGKPGVYPGYAPSADSNNPLQYAATVGGWIGVDPNALLGAAPGFQDQLGGDFWHTVAGNSIEGLSGPAIAGIAIVAGLGLVLLLD